MIFLAGPQFDMMKENITEARRRKMTRSFASARYRTPTENCEFPLIHTCTKFPPSRRPTIPAPTPALATCTPDGLVREIVQPSRHTQTLANCVVDDLALEVVQSIGIEGKDVACKEAVIDSSRSTHSAENPHVKGPISDDAACDFNGTALVDRPSVVEEVVQRRRLLSNNIACDESGLSKSQQWTTKEHTIKILSFFNFVASSLQQQNAGAEKIKDFSCRILFNSPLFDQIFHCLRVSEITNAAFRTARSSRPI